MKLTKHISRRHYSHIAFVAISLVLFLSSYRINQNHHERGGIIRSDALGYYSWLPALIIYQDSDFEFLDTVFVESSYYPENYAHHIVKPASNGERMNKYNPGAALSVLPFFLVTHSYATVIGQKRGYEVHYQWMWWFASVFFVCFGFFFLFKMGSDLELPWWSVLLVCGGVLFGTNLFHYATFDSGISHSFSFGWICYALYQARRLQDEMTGKRYVLLAFGLGMVVLVRSFNLLMIPGFLILFSSKQLFAKEKRKHLVTAVLVFASMILLLLCGNYWQSGAFLVYPYGEESFNFSKPHLYEFFFGFEVGAFVYSPFFGLMILLVGWLAYRAKRLKQYGLFLVWFLVMSYVLSCWETWGYGCTLGNRPFVDWYPFFTVLFLLYFKRKRPPKTISLLLIPLVFGLVWYSQIVHYQYRNWIIDWCHMDKEKFHEVFLKTDDAYKFYCSNPWNYDFAQNEVMLKDTTLTGSFLVETKEYHILHYPMLTMLEGKNHRVKVMFEARFPEHRSEAKLACHVGQNEAYFDYRQKFIKKNVKLVGEYQPFQLEFHVPKSNKPVDITVSIIDNEHELLEIRNVQFQWISYD